jgi:hypothetical protein
MYSPTLPPAQRLAALRTAIRAGVRDPSAPCCCGLPMFDVGMEVDDTGTERIRVTEYECDACFRRTYCDEILPLPGSVCVAHAHQLTTAGDA